MRVTNSLFYTNSKNDYQRNMQELYKVNTQIASKTKILNSFEDSGVYVDTMRLNYEVATLEQIKESSSKAKTYANNTDKVLNQFTDALTQFKTKLVQAASESNSSTSLDALGNELEALRNHMVNLGNTSINGQYLFSGTAVTTRPFNADGTYNGNDGEIEAIIGSGVKLPYNITGEDLFLGSDTDYNKILSTNVKMFNQSKLHPDIMIDDGTLSEEVYLSETDTIRDLVGDSDNDKTNDPDALFYVSGRNSDGDAFSEKIQMSSSSEVSDLLESIGNAYGNTSTNKVVDVNMNAHGQIEIKDLRQGNALLDFHIFGAVDRGAGAGTVGNADKTDVDELLSGANVDIIEFTKSNYNGGNTADTISSREDIFNPGTFHIGYPMKTSDGEFIKTTTVLSDFMPSDVDHINVNGTNVNTTDSVQDLMNEIEIQFGGTARLENGKIIVDGLTSDATLIAEDATNVPTDGFSIPDAMNYERQGFEKNGNELLGNVSQIIKSNNDYAIASTKLIEVAGISTFDDISIGGDETQLILNGIDKDGTVFNVQIDLTNGAGGTTFSLDGGITNYTVLNTDGNSTKADDMTYKQLLDVVSLATSGIPPEDPIATNTNSGAIATAIAATTPSQAQLDAATAGATSQNVKDYILEAIDLGILQAAAVDPIEIASLNAKKNEALRMADATHYSNLMQRAQYNVEVTLDYKGKMKIEDTKNSESKIEFSMYDKDTDSMTASSSLNFMTNNAVTIEEPNLDFFKDLDQMIEAVRSGNYRIDSDNADPRNIGIQNSLARIDHVMDHVTKEHTKIGSYSNALSRANERSELLSINVQTVRSEIIDVDVGEAYMKFNQLANSYQATLSTVAKINSMTLLNYM